MNLTEPQAGSDLGPAQEPRGEERRPLPGHRPEDLHHLRRARHGRQHRAPGAGAHARRAGRRARHLAVHRAEVPGRRRRQAGQAQRPALRVAGAQARHPCQPDLRDVVRRRRRRGRLPGRRGRPRALLHVHHDEQRAALGRHPGPGDRRARLPAGRGLRQAARAVQGRRQRQAAARLDHPSRRRAPHADDHARPDRGHARPGLLHRRRHRRRAEASRPRRRARSRTASIF